MESVKVVANNSLYTFEETIEVEHQLKNDDNSLSKCTQKATAEGRVASSSNEGFPKIIIKRPKNELVVEESNAPTETIEENTSSWCREASFLLLDVAKNHKDSILTNDLLGLKKMYDHAAKKLTSCGHFTTALQCENRWKELEREYFKYVDNINKMKAIGCSEDTDDEMSEGTMKQMEELDKCGALDDTDTEEEDLLEKKSIHPILLVNNSNIRTIDLRRKRDADEVPKTNDGPIPPKYSAIPCINIVKSSEHQPIIPSLPKTQPIKITPKKSRKNRLNTKQRQMWEKKTFHKEYLELERMKVEYKRMKLEVERKKVEQLERLCENTEKFFKKFVEKNT